MFSRPKASRTTPLPAHHIREYLLGFAVMAAADKIVEASRRAAFVAELIDDEEHPVRS